MATYTTYTSSSSIAASAYTKASTASGQMKGAAAADAAKIETNASFAKRTTALASDAQEATIHKWIMDRNRDGVVSDQESIAHSQEITAHRDQIDTNGDGKLTFAEELKWALDQGQVSKSEVSRLLKLDSNKDGQISKLEMMSADMRGVEQMKKQQA